MKDNTQPSTQHSALSTQDLITSAANPLIKRIRALEQRKTRRAQGAFFVEGIRAVWLAVEHGRVEVIIIAPELLTSGAARWMVEQQAALGMRVAYVNRALFESIAERDNPSGLAAIVAIVPTKLAQLAVTPTSLFVALHEVGNPGNLGTIIRTVDAVGGSGVILLGSSTDPYHPTAVKASMGTLFTVPTVALDSSAALLAWCKAERVNIYTTSDHAAAFYWSVRYQMPALFLFGSEGEGLAADLLQQGEAVRIPMSGSADSLNLAVATAVLLYEVKRQREA
jgi:RNA methyltransferase, TrmH family